MQINTSCPTDEVLAELAVKGCVTNDMGPVAAHVQACSECDAKVQQFRNLGRRLALLKGADAAAQCPRAEELWGYVTRNANDPDSFELHAAHCPTCAGLLALLAGSSEDVLAPRASVVPPEKLQRLKGLWGKSGALATAQKPHWSSFGYSGTRWLPLGAAVAALIALVVGLSLFWRTPVAPLQIVASLKSPPDLFELHDEAQDRWEPLKANEQLASGARLRSKERPASLALSDGSTLSMPPGTVFRVTALAAGLQVRLEEGAVLVAAARQAPGSRLEVASADGSVVVKGTLFEVLRTGGRTVVSVVEGVVQCVCQKRESTLSAGFRQSMQADDLLGDSEKIEDVSSVASWLRNPEPPRAANLMQNPGAEELEGDKPKMWALYVAEPPEAEWGATTDHSHAGQRCAFLRITGFDKNNFACTGLVAGDSNGYNGRWGYALESNARYRFSFWIRGTGFKSRIGVGPWCFHQDGNGRDRCLESAVLCVPTEKWTRHEAVFSVPAGAARAVLVFFIHALKDRDIDAGATFYVDDVSLEKVAD
jgi:hypothetical protein